MGASDIELRIKELQDELTKTKYNKRTEHHFAMVKAQIAKLRAKLEIKTSSKKGKKTGFNIKKSGDATVVFVGFPSVGKSTLLNKLTNAQSEVGAYEFTTLDVKPGMLNWKGAKIQILDVPGIIKGASMGKGRGREVLSAVRSCNMVILLVDALHPEHKKTLLKELYNSNIRVNQRKPRVKISRNKLGGVFIHSTVKLTKVSINSLKTVLRQLRYVNADIIIRENITLDQFIDVLEGNKIYIPLVTVISKIDLISKKRLSEIIKLIDVDSCVSAETGEGIIETKDVLFDKLKFIRIYLKEIRKEPDLKEPLIVRRGINIKGVCRKIHKDFVKKFRFAKIWGPSAKFPGQIFRTTEKVLQDEDIIELHLN